MIINFIPRRGKVKNKQFSSREFPDFTKSRIQFFKISQSISIRNNANGIEFEMF